MNILIIRSIFKALSFLLITFTSILNSYEITESVFSLYNNNDNKNLDVVNTVIDYKTNITYNSKIPSGVTNVLVEGQDGIVYIDSDGNITKTLREKVDEVIEVGTGRYGEFVGVVTGYGPDCKTCDGRGYVACKTPTGKWTNLITDGIYYEDSRYGSLQILAADWRGFPCGTVIEVKNSDLSEPILGIVLDTGSAMRRAYDNGYVHIDVAFQTEVGLRFNTNKSTSFSVKRWGW